MQNLRFYNFAGSPFETSSFSTVQNNKYKHVQQQKDIKVQS